MKGFQCCIYLLALLPVILGIESPSYRLPGTSATDNRHHKKPTEPIKSSNSTNNQTTESSFPVHEETKPVEIEEPVQSITPSTKPDPIHTIITENATISSTAAPTLNEIPVHESLPSVPSPPTVSIITSNSSNANVTSTAPSVTTTLKPSNSSKPSTANSMIPSTLSFCTTVLVLFTSYTTK